MMKQKDLREKLNSERKISFIKNEIKLKKKKIKSRGPGMNEIKLNLN